jgi:hypothetical protein
LISYEPNEPPIINNVLTGIACLWLLYFSIESE